MHAERREYRLVLSNVDRGISLARRASAGAVAPPVRDAGAPDPAGAGLGAAVRGAAGVRPRASAPATPPIWWPPISPARSPPGWPAATSRPTWPSGSCSTTARPPCTWCSAIPPGARPSWPRWRRWGTRLPRGWDRLALWSFDPGLIAALAANESLRQRWTLTVVGDHLYADTGPLRGRRRRSARVRRVMNPTRACFWQICMPACPRAPCRWRV